MKWPATFGVFVVRPDPELSGRWLVQHKSLECEYRTYGTWAEVKENLERQNKEWEERLKHTRSGVMPLVKWRNNVKVNR